MHDIKGKTLGHSKSNKGYEWTTTIDAISSGMCTTSCVCFDQWQVLHVPLFALWSELICMELK